MSREGDRGWAIGDSGRVRMRISECDLVSVHVRALVFEQESFICQLCLSPIAYPPSPSFL
jgi:hypothetical protein